jgi:NADH-quinone oxidoreductase subunit C
MSTLSNDITLEKIRSHFGDDIISQEETFGMLSLTVNKGKIIEILSWLRDNQELQFNFLTDLTGIHYPLNIDKELGIVYHLHSFNNNQRLRVKTFFSISDNTIPTASSIWASANWMERETYDFFGINFEGHPDLRRILNVDDLGYFPMLKQYPLEDQTRADKTDLYFGR